MSEPEPSDAGWSTVDPVNKIEPKEPAVNTTATATVQILCGNHEEPIYHESVAQVRLCYQNNSTLNFFERQARERSARMVDGATERQVNFLLTLSAERGRPTTQEQAERLTKKQASDLITVLLDTPKTATVPAATLPEVPAGRYAVEIDSTLGFFKVDRPTEGRWAGRTFVKQMASDLEYPVRGARAIVVLDLIAPDPRAASLRYGREIGACGICGRTLTDENSRAAGIGPICAGKIGW